MADTRFPPAGPARAGVPSPLRAGGFPCRGEVAP